MSFFEGWSIEQLNRLLSASRWILGVFAVLTAIAGVFNQYVSDKISILQKTEKQNAEDRFKAAEVKIKTTEEGARKLEEQVKTSEQARLELEQKVAPRKLTDKQIQCLVNGFSGLGKSSEPPTVLIVATRMMDAESIAYGKQIKEAITKAAIPVSFTEFSSHSFKGIAIFHNPKTDDSHLLKNIRNIFTKASIPFLHGYLDIKQIPIQQEPAIYIVVGHK